MSAFLLIRHAQSTWNATGRWQGQADPPLSDAGTALTVQAAALLFEQQQFDLVVTSDLQRARRTGELLAAGPPGDGLTPDTYPDRPSRPTPRVVVEPRLREFHVGDWSGLTRAEIEQRWPSQLALFDSGRLTGAPGGETRAAFDARVQAAARRVGRLIARRGPARTLIVTHGGVIRSLVRSAGLEERHIPNLAGYEGTAHSGGLLLRAPVDLVRQSGSSQISGPVAL